MPKSKKKRKNGKTKRANGVGSLDRARATAPKTKWTPPRFDIDLEARKLRSLIGDGLGDQFITIDSMTEIAKGAPIVISPEVSLVGVHKCFAMAEHLYGTVNTDTLNAAAACIKDQSSAIEELITAHFEKRD